MLMPEAREFEAATEAGTIAAPIRDIGDVAETRHDGLAYRIGRGFAYLTLILTGLVVGFLGALLAAAAAGLLSFAC